MGMADDKWTGEYTYYSMLVNYIGIGQPESTHWHPKWWSFECPVGPFGDHGGGELNALESPRLITAAYRGSTAPSAGACAYSQLSGAGTQGETL